MSSRKDATNARIAGGRLPEPQDKDIRDVVKLYFTDEIEVNRILKGISDARFSASLAYTHDLATRSGLSQNELVKHLIKIQQSTCQLAETLSGQRVSEAGEFPKRSAEKINHALTIGIRMGGNPADDALAALHTLNYRVKLSLKELQRIDERSGTLAKNRWISGIEKASRSQGRKSGSADVGLDRFLLEMKKIWTGIRGKEILLTVDQDKTPKDEFFYFLEKYFTSDKAFESDKSYWARALQERCRGLAFDL